MKLGRTGFIIMLAVLPWLTLNCADDQCTRPDSNSGAPDSIAPATVLDLVAEPVTASSVLLTWTAPGDDGLDGIATDYDIRHSFLPVMSASRGFWGNATPIPESMTPRLQGERECLLVTELDADTLYYFGVRAGDEIPNWSGVSNVVSYSTARARPLFGAYDAEFMALEISGELLPPTHLVERIGKDLAVIRAVFPYMKSVGYFPDWPAGQLLLHLTDEAWEQYELGSYDGLDQLNAEYGPAEIISSHSLDHFIRLQFNQPYNPVLLAEIYEGAEGVDGAYPSGLIGDGGSIEWDQHNTYTFEQAWGFCQLGCAYRHFWVIEVEGCDVELLDEYGSPLAVTWTSSERDTF